MKIACFLIAVFGLTLPAMSTETTTAPTKPNVLIIVGDDMGYADVGFHGSKELPTPNLDALAASGVKFTSGYVSGPYCSPTRAGLLTGRYQQRFGHEFNPAGKNGLPLTEQTLADRLKANGYRTALVGKWHLGNEKGMHPLDRGFDEFFGFLGGAHSYFDVQGVQRGRAQVDSLDYTTDAFANEAVSYVERNKDKPWFLYLAFNAVHTPMHATEKYLERFKSVSDEKRRTYCAMMSAMDDAIGQVRNKLKETGQLENTLIAFISDNGGPTMNGTTTNASINKPLRGSKRTTLEGGIRVPFVLSWPDKLKPSVYDKPVIQLDLHATALAAANITPQASWKLDGVDLLPYLTASNSKTTSDPPHAALFWRFGQQMAIRAGDWKLVAYDGNADTNTGKRQPVSSAKLYNLAKDIHEDHDLSAENPQMVKQLQAQWDQWNQGNVAPLWGNNGGGESDSQKSETAPDKNTGKNKK